MIPLKRSLNIPKEISLTILLRKIRSKSMRNHYWISLWTLIRREIARFMGMRNMTIFPQMISTALYIIIFGFSLGGRIKEIHGFHYIEFIFPGLVLMGVITSSYNNASNYLFMARYDTSIQDILLTPLSYLQMVFAFTIGSIIRGLIVGVLVLATGCILLKLPIYSMAATLIFLLLTSLIFASFGIITGLWAERWEDLALFINYIVTPLNFLGGIFYSIDMLPPWWRHLSLLNPIFYMVNGFRYGILGFNEIPLSISFALMSALSIFLFFWTVYLFKIGYKLKT
ncbi:MAG TPA: ABC transporter [Deltaproteobacteria bacterium]|nr:ABC transporter [Deltaproteobacteria bacterium]